MVFKINYFYDGTSRKNQGVDDVSEVVTVCGTQDAPHDIDGDPGGDVNIPLLLCNRVLSA